MIITISFSSFPGIIETDGKPSAYSKCDHTRSLTHINVAILLVVLLGFVKIFFKSIPVPNFGIKEATPTQ